MQTEDIILWVDKAIELRESSYELTNPANPEGYKPGDYTMSHIEALDRTRPPEAKDYDESIALWMIEYGNDVTEWKKQIEENPKIDLKSELRNCRYRLTELLDKTWELSGVYVGEKEYESYDWVKDARKQIEDISKAVNQ